MTGSIFLRFAAILYITIYIHSILNELKNDRIKKARLD